jgi:hypothetical protein
MLAIAMAGLVLAAGERVGLPQQLAERREGEDVGGRGGRVDLGVAVVVDVADGRAVGAVGPVGGVVEGPHLGAVVAADHPEDAVGVGVTGRVGVEDDLRDAVLVEVDDRRPSTTTGCGRGRRWRRWGGAARSACTCRPVQVSAVWHWLFIVQLTDLRTPQVNCGTGLNSWFGGMYDAARVGLRRQALARGPGRTRSRARSRWTAGWRTASASRRGRGRRTRRGSRSRCRGSTPPSTGRTAAGRRSPSGTATRRTPGWRRSSRRCTPCRPDS